MLLEAAETCFPTDMFLQQIPVVVPFLGCTFGGWLYDTFLFQGESPINTPWMGLERVVRPTRAKWSSGHYNKEKEDGSKV